MRRSSTASFATCCRRSPRLRAPSARRRSGTAARSAGTSPPPRPPGTRCRRCSSRAPRSSAPRFAALGACRPLPLGQFVTGVKRNALEQDELITAVHLMPSNAPQTFMKIGPRNAMVIAVVSLAVSGGDELRASFGSASPRPALVTAPRDEAESFPERVAAAAAPIDDVRGSEAYRRHALRVLTHRALERVLA